MIFWLLSESFQKSGSEAIMSYSWILSRISAGLKGVTQFFNSALVLFEFLLILVILKHFHHTFLLLFSGLTRLYAGPCDPAGLTVAVLVL